MKVQALLFTLFGLLIGLPTEAAIPSCDAAKSQDAETTVCKVGPSPTGEPNGTRLCISDLPGDQRFSVTVDWSTALNGGGQGSGNALALEDLGIRRGGMFWFFSSDNPELLVKVLDGCAINGNYWVFWSAGTTVGLVLTVDDTFAGLQAVYRNTDGTPAAPVADTFAFPCDS